MENGHTINYDWNAVWGLNVCRILMRRNEDGPRARVRGRSLAVKMTCWLAR